MSKGDSQLDISTELLELIERRLADKVQERVLQNARKIGLLLATLVTVLGAFGLKEVYSGLSLLEAQREEALRLQDEIQASKDLLEREIVGFRETVLPEFRLQMRRWAALERRVAFTENCKEPMAVESSSRWFVDRFGRDMTEFELTSFGEYFERYNVCSQEQVDFILDHSVQELVTSLYASILSREPDPFGRFVWGIRLIRGYTYEEVRSEILNSSEAQSTEE
ncbi:MAG: hypothetical protein AAGC60_20530 [Acidobacteriota bacterium]